MKKKIIIRQGAAMGILSVVFLFTVEANLNPVECPCVGGV